MYGGTLHNPTARLQHRNVQSLRSGELIRAIIAGHGHCALSFGERVENEIGLDGLPDASLPELQSIDPTISREDFAKIMAAIELGRRVAEAKSKPLPRCSLNSTRATIEFCQLKFARLASDARQEQFHVITLDSKNRVINAHLVSIGTLDASLVHPREVFRPAIKDAASSVIVVHNHPSGDPAPSKEDLQVTKRLESAGKTLGIECLDHIIVAREGTASVREINEGGM